MKKITAALLLTAMLASLATAASASDTDIGYRFGHHVSSSGESLFTIEYTELEDSDSDDEEDETDDSDYNVTVFEPVIAELEQSSVSGNTYTYLASNDTAKNVSKLTFDLFFNVDTEEEEEKDDGIIYAWIQECTEEDDCVCWRCLEERKVCDDDEEEDELTLYSKIDIAVYGSNNVAEEGWERIPVEYANAADGTAELELNTGRSYTDFKVVVYTDGSAEIDNMQLSKTLMFRHAGDTVPEQVLARYAKYWEN